ncbi:MAG: sigma-70 family RNA polymerase sigma factor [Treponema sp.]|uniref:sigma-70 family RNA polymerase sigma factor n=1 Tax=Treponema sp. TaxID=166 RepID=UPI0025F70CE2|nr:RNA polymerase sigma factor RpoD/SigA [Treponema sp.]MBQ9622526.1 sigma-70 family RNA polymerase sigma factor [Treponema sp.]MBR0497437.1 sigma-70 family RNA polymerase sigma factor [Treponema sp.]
MKMYESYLKQIQRFPLLSAAEEKELAGKILAKDKKALNRLVNSNLRLVVSIAAKFKSTYKVSIMDLIQEGNLGLIFAAEKFSGSHGTRFSTYAYPWILQYMLRFLHNKTNMISIPQRKEEILRKISDIRDYYADKNDKKASLKEFASSLGISEKELKDSLNCLFTCTSLDCECGEDNANTIGDLIPDFTYNPEQQFFMECAKSNIKELVAKLSEKERVIISSRYNLDGQVNVPTLRELGASLGVSTETIRQTEIKALKKIRDEVGKTKMELYTA